MWCKVTLQRISGSWSTCEIFFIVSWFGTSDLFVCINEPKTTSRFIEHDTCASHVPAPLQNKAQESNSSFISAYWFLSKVNLDFHTERAPCYVFLFWMSIPLFSSLPVFSFKKLAIGAFFRSECMFPVSKYMRIYTFLKCSNYFFFFIFLLFLQSEEDKDLISLPSLENIVTFKLHCGSSLQTFNTPIDKWNIQNRPFKNVNNTNTQLYTGRKVKIIF